MQRVAMPAKDGMAGVATALPAAAAVGLREPHAAEFLQKGCPAPWVEIHSENYTMPGGPRLERLLEIRKHIPVSAHGVGLSLGSAEGLDKEHLQRLRMLYGKLQPVCISEHLSWSVTGGTYYNELLPLPYTAESLDIFVRNVTEAQEFFGRTILVENPSRYLALSESEMEETDFIHALCRRTGCGLLLDLNNVYVSAHNLGFSPEAYVDAIDPQLVGEIHLAGHSTIEKAGDIVLYDDHGSAVQNEVLSLLSLFCRRAGPRPILIEWDTSLPSLDVLLAEAGRVQQVMDAPEASHAA